MHIDLAGRRALVTGAATGIGRAIALGLAHAGAAVAVKHLGRAAEAEAVVAACGTSSIAIEADVSRAREGERLCATTVASLGGLDILVNNAAVVLVKPFLEITEEEWDRVLATQLKSVFLCCRAALPVMLASDGGCVINVASELGYLGRAQYAPYTAAKGGVITLTRSLAREFAPRVRINGIAPGPTDTPMLASELALTGAHAAETDMPAGRLGRPEEIGSTAVVLASSHASFYHGDMLSPNGGALTR